MHKLGQRDSTIGGIFVNPELRYVLENEIENKQCTLCYAMWFVFDHYGKICYYRLGQNEPALCKVCAPIDEEIESGALVTSERWVNLDS